MRSARLESYERGPQLDKIKGEENNKEVRSHQKNSTKNRQNNTKDRTMGIVTEMIITTGHEFLQPRDRTHK